MGVPEDQTTAVPEDSKARQTHTDSTSVSSSDGLGEKDVREVDETKVKDPESQSVAASEPEDTSKYPHGLKLITLIIALCLAVFLVALDQTIIATAIPKITDRFHSINDIGWYGSAYFLTSTTLQPSFGRIYKVFQIKWVFLTAISIFELGSLVCAVAPSSTALIVGRAVAVSEQSLLRMRLPYRKPLLIFFPRVSVSAVSFPAL
jgi:hypothetical protein